MAKKERHILVDEGDWAQFKKLASGLNTTPAMIINMMIRQANIQGGIPFSLNLSPNANLEPRPVLPVEGTAPWHKGNEVVEEIVEEPTADLGLTGTDLFG